MNEFQRDSAMCGDRNTRLKLLLQKALCPAENVNFFQRFSLYFDSVYSSILTRSQCPTHNTSTVLFATPFGASFRVGEPHKKKSVFQYFLSENKLCVRCMSTDHLSLESKPTTFTE